MDYEGVVLTHFGMKIWQACSNVQFDFAGDLQPICIISQMSVQLF